MYHHLEVTPTTKANSGICANVIYQLVTFVKHHYKRTRDLLYVVTGCSLLETGMPYDGIFHAIPV